MDERNTDLRTSVTEIDNCLIVALTGEMTDDNIQDILDIITARAYQSRFPA
jgi:subtilase family serine protease